MQNKKILFCFAYAGGNKDFFDVIKKDLNGIVVIGVEYAGHGERNREDFYRDFDELSKDMFEQLKDKYTGGEYALFGYSMGSISVVEVLKRIIASGMPLPSNVFLAAHEPYTKSGLFDFTANGLYDWVKNRTVKFGAVPEKLLNNKVFWRMYLPVYRADYTIIGKYKFEKLNLETNVPATVFYSETDTPLEKMKLWKDYFVGDCEFYQYQGTHFFIQEHHKEMAKVIVKKMGEIYDI